MCKSNESHVASYRTSNPIRHFYAQLPIHISRAFSLLDASLRSFARLCRSFSASNYTMGVILQLNYVFYTTIKNSNKQIYLLKPTTGLMSLSSKSRPCRECVTKICMLISSPRIAFNIKFRIIFQKALE